MNAFEILEWICQESISGEDLDLVDVPDVETQTKEWWCDTMGGCPPHTIPSGSYLYYYQSAICDTIYFGGQYHQPDAQIEIPDENGFDYIYLYRIDDTISFDAIEYNQQTLKEWVSL